MTDDRMGEARERRGFKVRAATLADAPAMARVFVDTFRTAHRGQIPEHLLLERTYESSTQGWERTLREIAAAEDPQEYVCVAEDTAGEIVGIAMGGPPADWPFDDANRAAHPTGECYSLYVHTTRQRSGIGRALLADLATFLVSRGRRRLAIGVLAVNAPARAFYERIGGTLLGQRHFDDSGVLLDEVVYIWNDATCLTRVEPANSAESEDVRHI
ncbi:N-acetyltransferase family protein [Actinopolymorpha singaporensis]|nr:GNAT family N-acetyltransferase [Actinopolymorpha singaporensis]